MNALASLTSGGVIDPVAYPVASSRMCRIARNQAAFEAEVQTTLWPCQTINFRCPSVSGGRA